MIAKFLLLSLLNVNTALGNEESRIYITGFKNEAFNLKTSTVIEQPYRQGGRNGLADLKGERFAELDCIKPSSPSWNSWKTITAEFFNGTITIFRSKHQYEFESLEECKRVEDIILNQASKESPIEIVLNDDDFKAYILEEEKE